MHHRTLRFTFCLLATILLIVPVFASAQSAPVTPASMIQGAEQNASVLVVADNQLLASFGSFLLHLFGTIHLLGNVGLGAMWSFAQTLSGAPVISNISSGTPGGTTATVTWTTNENASSKVVYGTTTSYGSASSSASLVTSHSISLTGLASATTYHYAVVSSNSGGNTSTSTDQTFTTAGSAQFPSLLSGYPVRPPWQVAGVDYAVGVPATTTLQNPATISMAGVTVNTSTYTVDVTGNGVTLNGYDFSLNGGWSVFITGATTTIENCLFGASGDPLDDRGGGLTVLHSTFNGGGAQIGAQVSYNTSETGAVGSYTEEYNLFENAGEDVNDIGGTLTSVLVTDNLFYDNGQISGAHPDTDQFNGATTSDYLFEYNTIYQTAAGVVAGGMEGIQISDQLGGDVTNAVVTDNTLIATGSPQGTAMSWMVTTDPNTTATMSNNYFDQTGAYGVFYPPPENVIPNASGNIDLSNGDTIELSNTEVPTISSIASSTSATSATVTWTTNENASSKVVYGTTTSYGSASSSASLVTSHSISLTGLTASTTYHYAVVSADGSGNTATSTDQTFTTTSTCPQGSSYADGCSAAPAGTPNASGLFTDNQATGGTSGTYTVRPPWNVAGVDYRTGYDTTITLKSPDSGGFPACADTTTYPHTITVDSAPCTISGYDLSLDGGWAVMTMSSCTSGTVTLKNNNFIAGSNSTTYLVDALGNCNLDLESNTFDGNGCNYPNNLSALVSYSGTGTFTAHYNQFLNSPEHDINFEQPSGSGYVASSSFNYFRTVGYYTGSHANPFIFNTSGSFASFTSKFDTIIIPSTTGDYSAVGMCPANSAIAGAGSSGNIYLSSNGSTLSGVVVGNDTLIASPVRGGAQGFDTFLVRADGGDSVPSPQIVNNYFDVSGILTAGDPFLETDMTTPTISGNVLLTNGHSCNADYSCN